MSPAPRTPHTSRPGRGGWVLLLMAAAAILPLPGCLQTVHEGSSTPLPVATVDEANTIDQAQQLITDGLYDQARTKLNLLFAHGCRHPQALMLEARLTFQQGDFEQSIPWCEKAIVSSPLWFEPRILLAQCYLKLKRYTNATACFEDIDRIAPELPWGPYGIGTIAATRGDTKTAVKELDLALLRDSTHAPSLEGRAGLARLLGDRATEELMLRRYVVQEPLDADAHERIGELAVSAGRREDARRAFERAYAITPYAEIAAHLMDLAHQRGDAAAERHWAELAGTTVKTPTHPVHATD